MEDELMTVEEVADRLRLNQQTVRNWIDSGDLPAFRVGRRVRVARPDLEAFMASSRTDQPRPVRPDLPDGLSIQLPERLTPARRRDLAAALRAMADALDPRGASGDSPS